jgi:hypothetical protein
MPPRSPYDLRRKKGSFVPIPGRRYDHIYLLAAATLKVHHVSSYLSCLAEFSDLALGDKLVIAIVVSGRVHSMAANRTEESAWQELERPEPMKDIQTKKSRRHQASAAGSAAH